MTGKNESVLTKLKKVCPTFEQQYYTRNRLSLTYPPSDKAFVYTSSGSYRIRLVRAAIVVGAAVILLDTIKRYKKWRLAQQIEEQMQDNGNSDI